MKLGYQDVGSWTLLKSTPLERRKAALALCPVLRRQDDLAEEDHVGLTPIRDSPTSATRASPSARPSSAAWSSSTAARRASPGRRRASTCPTIRSWPSCGGRTSPRPSPARRRPQQAMDNLAKQQDEVLARLERAGIGGDCAPKLNPETSAERVVRRSRTTASSSPSPSSPTRSRRASRSTTTCCSRPGSDGKVMPEGIKG